MGWGRRSGLDHGIKGGRRNSKVSFLTTFFQHATFIASGNDPPGTIGACIYLGGDTESTARYSFLRLIGCAYYKQHTSAFRSQTPEALFHSISSGTSTYDHHNRWLTKIRNIVRQRVDSESKCMPSTEALLLHWKRSIWVLAMWNCATHNTVDLPGWLDNIHTYNSNMNVHVPYMYIHILGTVHIHILYRNVMYMYMYM